MEWTPDPTEARSHADAFALLTRRSEILRTAMAPPTEDNPEPEIAPQYASHTLTYAMFGPVQPSESGGNFKFFPPDVGEWHHGGQMFTGWNVNLYFGPNGGGFAHPEIVQARWQLVWQPSSSHIKARICHHAMSADDPDYDPVDFNITTIAEQPGEEGVGPVPRGAWIRPEMEALRLNGWPKMILTQFYMDQPGEYAILTKSVLELTVKVRV